MISVSEDIALPRQSMNMAETTYINGLNGQHRSQDSASNGVDIIDVPVLIVGGGPSGLLQAYLLSKLGGKDNSASLECKFSLDLG
jgi:hypothetical protein